MIYKLLTKLSVSKIFHPMIFSMLKEDDNKEIKEKITQISKTKTILLLSNNKVNFLSGCLFLMGFLTVLLVFALEPSMIKIIKGDLTLNLKTFIIVLLSTGAAFLLFALRNLCGFIFKSNSEKIREQLLDTFNCSLIGNEQKLERNKESNGAYTIKYFYDKEKNERLRREYSYLYEEFTVPKKQSWHDEVIDIIFEKHKGKITACLEKKSKDTGLKKSFIYQYVEKHYRGDIEQLLNNRPSSYTIEGEEHNISVGEGVDQIIETISNSMVNNRGKKEFELKFKKGNQILDGSVIIKNISYKEIVKDIWT